MEETQIASVADALKRDGRYIGGFQGCSMRPMLNSNRDAVLILPVTHPVRKYDVLLYRSPKPGKLVLHRVVKLRRDGSMVIRGDNCYFDETDITPDRIVGILGGYYKGRDPKMRSLDAPAYRLYARWRVLNYPLRRVFRALRNAAYGVYRAIWKRGKDKKE